ncbi:MAG: Fructose-1,6-bisphosphatase [Chloroflexi bacterium]|jgi:fructose-1,6-bisphosphatase/inositol monophosphatase family enzyme|nr:MAG: Fructose-1,6-bisphosphatase [Chloroflexota bacterium]
MPELTKLTYHLDKYLRQLIIDIPQLDSSGFGRNTIGAVPGRQETEDVEIGLDKYSEDLLETFVKKSQCNVQIYSEHSNRTVGNVGQSDYLITCDPFDGSGHYMRGIPAEWWAVITVWDPISMKPVWAGASDINRKELYFADSNGVKIDLLDGNEPRSVAASKQTKISDNSIIAAYLMSPEYIRHWTFKSSRFLQSMEENYPQVRIWTDGGACSYPWLARGITNAYMMFNEPRSEIDPGLGFAWASGVKVYAVSDSGELNEYVFDPQKSSGRVPWLIAACNKKFAVDLVHLTLNG